MASSARSLFGNFVDSIRSTTKTSLSSLPLPSKHQHSDHHQQPSIELNLEPVLDQLIQVVNHSMIYHQEAEWEVNVLLREFDHNSSSDSSSTSSGGGVEMIRNNEQLTRKMTQLNHSLDQCGESCNRMCTVLRNNQNGDDNNNSGNNNSNHSTTERLMTSLIDQLNGIVSERERAQEKLQSELHSKRVELEEMRSRFETYISAQKKAIGENIVTHEKKLSSQSSIPPNEQQKQEETEETNVTESPQESS